MMEPPTTRDVVLKACVDLGLFVGDPGDAALLRELFDELDVIEVLMTAEEAFGIELDDQVLNEAQDARKVTFGELVRFVDDGRRRQCAAP